MAVDLNTTRTLIAELGQALVTDDEKAIGIAALNLVGKFMETQERTATALEQLAAFAESLTYGNLINVKKVDH